jgi:hypothetical protein
MTDMPTIPAPPVRYAQIAYGDTLQAIALRETGDAANWLDLVVLNGLKPPYIASAAAAGVLTYGDVIQIPAGVSTITAEGAAADLYGTDVVVADDGSLPIVQGDFILVSGVPNLRAALARRVTVEKRELAFHPEFGCFVRVVIGWGNSPGTGQLAAFYVKSSLLEDDRVQDVPSCVAEVVGDRIRVNATVLPITGQPADLQVLI